MMKKQVKKVLARVKLRTYVGLGLLLVLLPIVLLSLFKPQASSATWMNDAWAYRVKVPVTAHTGAETNVYFTKTVDTSDTTKFQSDCGDIRFTDANGKLLQYYIASGCSSASTVIHVLVPTFPAGATDYFMYYGNPSASDGFSSTDFTAGTAVTVGSVGSEEKGSGPVVYWNFDEGYGTTANDGKKSMNGTLTNMASSSSGISGWQTDDLCVTGKCIAFDGTDDYVTVPDANVLDFTTSFTISAWVNARSTTGTDIAIINKGRDATATYAYEFGMDTGHFSLKLYDGTNNPTVAGTTTIQVQTWYFVTATYDGSTLKIYVNGKLENSASSSINIGAQTGALVLGKNANASDRYFSGKIDDAKLYNSALTATQIQNNYNNHGADDISSISLGTNSPKYLSDSLVGYWKMDETAANSCVGGSNDSCDSSGFGGDGAWVGTATSGGGKFGSSLALDGGGYVSVGSGPTISGTGVTLAAWIYPTATSTRDEILDVGGFNLLNLQNAKVCFYDGDVNSTYFCSTASISTNTWTHVLATYDINSNTERIYINGNLDSSFTPTGTPSGGTLPTTIGYCGACSTYAFVGKLDELRAYSRTLSNQEVRSLYNWGPGPVGYWKLDEKSGQSIYDSSTNGNTGTLGSSTATETTDPTWVTGKFGSGVLIDGSDDFVDFPNSPSLNLGATTDNYTLEAWAKVTNNGGWIVEKGQQAYGDFNISYAFNVNSSQQATFEILDGTNHPIAGASAATVLTSGVWYYLTGVRDTVTDKLYLYINGALAASTTDTTTATVATSQHMAFGNNGSGHSEALSGTVDEVKLYNYARTAQQIIEDMNGGHPTGGSPIGSYVSYWRMDEANGTTAHDYNSVSGNSLTLSTASWDTSGKTNAAWKGVGTNWLSRADDDDFDLAAADEGSISMWFKSTSATNPAATEYLFAKGRGTPPGYALYLNTSGFLCFSIDDDASWTPDDTACTTNDVYDGTWHHVVAEKKGTTELRLYLDGLSRATDTSIAATGTLANSGTIYVGDDDGDSTNSFNGDIDEVKFYRSALTADQVALDYNAGANINFGSTAAVESAQLTDGSGNASIGYWKLDEKTGTTTADNSGNGNTGTLTNGPLWVSGKYGSALSFDGSDDVVDVGSASTLDDLGPLTLEAWVYPKSLGEGGLARIFEKQATVNTLGWRLQLNTNNSLIFAQDYATVDLSQNTANNTLTLNAWNHVAVTWDGTTTVANVHIYVNGREVPYSSSTNGSGARQSDAAQTLKIGNTTDGTRTFDGIIDEAKVYNYARTAAQIAYDYNRGNPISWWRFDECQGGSVNDSSGNGNSGTITIGASGTQTAAGTCSTSSTAWGNGTSGKFNSSLNFDGTDDYVACTDASCGGTSKLDFGISAPFSFGAWINTSGAASKIILSKKDGTTSGSAGYLLQLSASNFAVCRVSDGTTQVSPTDTIALNDSAWHFVMCVHTGSALNLYVDGKLRVTSSTVSVTGSLDNVSDFRVGTTGTPSSNYFSGQIDDVRVYNYALSLTQVQKAMQGGSVNFGPSSGQP